MHQLNRSMLEPGTLAAAAFSSPLFSLLVAAVVAAGVALIRAWVLPSGARSAAVSGTAPANSSSPTLVARTRRDENILGWSAIAVIVVFVAEYILRNSVLSLANVVEWWQYATPVFTTLCALTVLVFGIFSRGSTSPDRRSSPQARRTWTSFSSPWELVGTAASFTALAAVTIAAGLASSTDETGRSIHLAIPIPNTQIDPIRPWFYGWAFGVPVLVCLVALLGVTWMVLRANSVRPFLRSDTVSAERRSRRATASGAVRMAAAGALLALAGALRLIQRAASITSVSVDGHSDAFEAIWKYSDLASIGGALAPVLEIVAFVAVFLVAVDSLRRTGHAPAAASPASDRTSNSSTSIPTPVSSSFPAVPEDTR